MDKNEFKCARCGEVFTKGWSDEEADKEAEERFGVKDASPNPDMSVVCDECDEVLFGRQFDEVLQQIREDLQRRREE